MSFEYLRLQSPEFELVGDVALSKLFGDRYFSDSGALAEKDHVFIAGNNLIERWKNQAYFSICELGFGCGINFFLTKKLWEETSLNRCQNSWLHYIAIENYPLTAAELLYFSESIGVNYSEIIAKLPPKISGTHTREFNNSRIRLTLIYKPVFLALKYLGGSIDTWFLDGFSPSLNLEMWNLELLKEIKRLSVSGTEIKSYSASGELKRNLEELGFKIELVPGFGRKKHNLKATYYTETIRRKPKIKNVAIIGAGLGGAALVRSFKARGFYVEVFDGANETASGASGNPAGILMPHLSLTSDPFSEFFVPGFTFSEGIFAATNKFVQSGVLRQATSDRLKNLFQALNESLPNFAEQNENKNLNPTSGIYFHLGGTVALRSLTQEWLRLADKVNLACKIENFESLKNEFEYVVLAAAHGIGELTSIPVEAVRGQILIVDPLKISLPICYEGYALPQIEGTSVIGATYNHNNLDLEYSVSQQEQLVERLKKAAPKLELSQLVGGRVSFRTMTRDRLPIIGPYYNEVEIRERYTNKTNFKFPASALDSRVFIASGYGSKGLLTAPIAAEIIAALICDEVRILPNNVLNQVQPHRFLTKDLRKS